VETKQATDPASRSECSTELPDLEQHPLILTLKCPKLGENFVEKRLQQGEAVETRSLNSCKANK
jgi:hypothetical protein